jgi:hypothetical protein
MTATLDTIDALEALPVKIDCVGQTKREDWDCDQWRVTLSSKAGFHSFDYYTGMGLRTRTYSGYGRKWDAMRKKHYDDKPKAPKVADVLHSLILDASAADENFYDWCANYGYSDDSIKAMNTYKACLEVAVALRKHFDADTLRQVRELLQDY